MTRVFVCQNPGDLSLSFCAISYPLESTVTGRTSQRPSAVPSAVEPMLPGRGGVGAAAECGPCGPWGWPCERRALPAGDILNRRSSSWRKCDSSSPARTVTPHTGQQAGSCANFLRPAKTEANFNYYYFFLISGFLDNVVPGKSCSAGGMAVKVQGQKV